MIVTETTKVTKVFTLTEAEQVSLSRLIGQSNRGRRLDITHDDTDEKYTAEDDAILSSLYGQLFDAGIQG